MKNVRNPRKINKATMGGCNCINNAKCPSCEYEFYIKKGLGDIDCPNCEQEYTVEEFLAFYIEAH